MAESSLLLKRGQSQVPPFRRSHLMQSVNLLLLHSRIIPDSRVTYLLTIGYHYETYVNLSKNPKGYAGHCKVLQNCYSGQNRLNRSQPIRINVFYLKQKGCLRIEAQP